jgi:predicted nucleotidyltransferase
MATTQLPPDFREFLQLLNSKDVEYLLVGGYAVGYHGYPRATGDMDIWVAIHPQNAERVVEVVREFGFDLPEVSTELFLREERIVRMGVPPFRIEIFTTISGVEFSECYAERVVDVMDGVEVSLINLEHLKANKQASGRPKDINDLQSLP